ncbi:hypothetical protein F5887DRAFT_915169 [Amanita rubescens]|nr:hypothetical protein F5887DRAFT_915169 [Amanita rubescens]
MTIVEEDEGGGEEGERQWTKEDQYNVRKRKTSLDLANNVLFRNVLVSMKPNVTKKDIPSTFDVNKYIHNQFVEWVKHQAKFQRHRTGGRPADTMKEGFLGMTAHWIEVKDGTWEMRLELVGFKLIAGEHSGLNLVRHFVALCDRVGIWTPEQSKLNTITLDNASNNTALCKTVATFHDCCNRTKTAMDQLPMVVSEMATSSGLVFIWTGPELVVTGCN